MCDNVCEFFFWSWISSQPLGQSLASRLAMYSPSGMRGGRLLPAARLDTRTKGLDVLQNPGCIFLARTEPSSRGPGSSDRRRVGHPAGPLATPAPSQNSRILERNSEAASGSPVNDTGGRVEGCRYCFGGQLGTRLASRRCADPGLCGRELAHQPPLRNPFCGCPTLEKLDPGGCGARQCL